MLVGPAESLPAAPDPNDADFEAPAALADAVAALDIAGNFMFDAATHRDFLGACLGTGIERDMVRYSVHLGLGRDPSRLRCHGVVALLVVSFFQPQRINFTI